MHLRRRCSCMRESCSCIMLYRLYLGKKIYTRLLTTCISEGIRIRNLISHFVQMGFLPQSKQNTALIRLTAYSYMMEPSGKTIISFGFPYSEQINAVHRCIYIYILLSEIFNVYLKLFTNHKGTAFIYFLTRGDEREKCSVVV